MVNLSDLVVESLRILNPENIPTRSQRSLTILLLNIFLFHALTAWLESNQLLYNMMIIRLYRKIFKFENKKIGSNLNVFKNEIDFYSI